MRTNPQFFIRGMLVLLLAGGIAVIALNQNAIAKLRADNQALLSESREAQQLARENADIPRLRNQLADLDKLREQNSDLLRLRSEVGRLRKQAARLDNLRTLNQQLKIQAKSLADDSSASGAAAFRAGSIARDSLRDVGFDTPGDTVQTLYWAMSQGNRERVNECMTGTDLESYGNMLLESQIRLMTNGLPGFTGYRITETNEMGPDRTSLILQASPGGRTMWILLTSNAGVWKVQR